MQKHVARSLFFPSSFLKAEKFSTQLLLRHEGVNHFEWANSTQHLHPSVNALRPLKHSKYYRVVPPPVCVVTRCSTLCEIAFYLFFFFNNPTLLTTKHVRVNVKSFCAQIRWTKTAGSVSDRFQDSSVFNETLHIAKILRTQGGRYYCKAENGLGSPAIKSIRVDVYCKCSISGL